MTDVQIVIRKDVPVPKRDVNFGPRGTSYPFADMVKGDSFALQIVGKPNQKKEDGTVLTVKQDAERKARQKQSYFSSLGKRLGIKIVTRWDAETGELGVWHNGERTADEKAADQASAPTAPADHEEPVEIDE